MYYVIVTVGFFGSVVPVAHFMTLVISLNLSLL